MARTRVEQPKKTARKTAKKEPKSAAERTLPLPLDTRTQTSPELTVRGPLWNDGELYLHREDLLLLMLAETKVGSGYQAIGLRKATTEKLLHDFDRALCTECRAKKADFERVLHSSQLELSLLTNESKQNEEHLRVVKRALNTAYNFDLDSGITYDTETGRIRLHGEPVTKETSNG